MNMASSDWLHKAKQMGLLPDDARLPDSAHRPWPLTLLTALGAWLAAIPLLALLVLLFAGVFEHGRQVVGGLIVGFSLWGGAIFFLRQKAAPLFLEQLAVPGMLAGTAFMAYGLSRELGAAGISLFLGGMALLSATQVASTWLRALLGATTVACLALAVHSWHTETWGEWRQAARLRLALAWYAAAAVLSLATWSLHGQNMHAGNAERWQAVQDYVGGAISLTLVGLAVWSGMTFLLGASLSAELHALEPSGLFERHGHWLPMLSIAANALALVALLRAWPSLKKPWLIAALSMSLLASWLMPSLGAVLLLMALLASTHHRYLALAAVCAAAWIIGAFYYSLTWPLATKALFLVGAGAVLAALAWWGWRVTPNPSNEDHAAKQTTHPIARTVSTARSGIMTWGLALCAIAVLAVVNGSIWHKQTIIAHGKPVLIELAPRDPRSLMQGDFMALNFQLPGHTELSLLGAQRPLALAQLDERGVATLVDVVRPDAKPLLSAQQLLIELTPKNGQWTLVTDAWFFKEGEADKWALARYGEFRVNNTDQALLVGMRDANLKPIQ